MLDDCKSTICDFLASAPDWNWHVSWNPRIKILVFYKPSHDPNGDAQHVIPIRLDRFKHFLKDSKQGRGIHAILSRWPSGAARLEDCRLIEPFETLAFFTQQAVFAGRQKQSLVDPLIQWLLLQGSSEAWLQRFHPELTSLSRYRLMKASLRELAAARGDRRFRLASLDSSDTITREKYWFALRFQYELAQEWFFQAGKSDPEAGLAFRESRISYLKVLKEEPYRLELDNFLDHMRKSTSKRTGAEAEVIRLLEIDPRSKKSTAPYEALLTSSDRHLLDLKFFPWFLECYDLISARKLIKRALPMREKVGFQLSVLSTFLAVILFAFQSFDKPLPILLLFRHGDPFTSDGAWLWQVVFQIASLLIAAWWAPESFNIILPRALFGSLVTWITLIFTSIPGLWAIDDDTHAKKLSVMVHRSLHENLPRTYLFAIPFFLLGLMFVMREISHWTKNPWIIFKRGIFTTAVLCAGALFWGILFAQPIRHLLTFPDPNDTSSSNCLFPIACIGASLAALFALVVELIWDDRSIAEPLEEPI